jgi:hypothetical protein
LPSCCHLSAALNIRLKVSLKSGFWYNASIAVEAARTPASYPVQAATVASFSSPAPKLHFKLAKGKSKKELLYAVARSAAPSVVCCFAMSKLLSVVYGF